MKKIVACETGHKYNDPAIQSNVIVDGVREESYGYAQIHLPSWTTKEIVTYEQAIDPDFAMNFLAEKMSQGLSRLWSCYKIVNSYN